MTMQTSTQSPTTVVCIDPYRWSFFLCDCLCKTDFVRSTSKEVECSFAMLDGLLYGLRSIQSVYCATDAKERVLQETLKLSLKRFDFFACDFSDISSVQDKLHSRLEENAKKKVFEELAFLGTFKYWRNPISSKQILSEKNLSAETSAVCDHLRGLDDNVYIHLHVERYDPHTRDPIAREQFQVILPFQSEPDCPNWKIIPLTINNLGNTGDEDYRHGSSESHISVECAEALPGILASVKDATAKTLDLQASIQKDINALVPVVSARFREMELEAKNASERSPSVMNTFRAPLRSHEMELETKSVTKCSPSVANTFRAPSHSHEMELEAKSARQCNPSERNTFRAPSGSNEMELEVKSAKQCSPSVVNTFRAPYPPIALDRKSTLSPAATLRGAMSAELNIGGSLKEKHNVIPTRHECLNSTSTQEPFNLDSMNEEEQMKLACRLSLSEGLRNDESSSQRATMLEGIHKKSSNVLTAAHLKQALEAMTEEDKLLIRAIQSGTDTINVEQPSSSSMPMQHRSVQLKIRTLKRKPSTDDVVSERSKELIEVHRQRKRYNSEASDQNDLISFICPYCAEDCEDNEDFNAHVEGHHAIMRITRKQ